MKAFIIFLALLTSLCIFLAGIIFQPRLTAVIIGGVFTLGFLWVVAQDLAYGGNRKDY